MESQAVDDDDEERAEKQSLAVVLSSESNVACCIFVLVCGPVLDALCALPGAVIDDVPSSLRTTSLILVVLLASPAIRTDLMFVLEQRAFIAILLTICGFVGLNQAGVSARNSDAVFALVGTLASIVASRSTVGSSASSASVSAASAASAAAASASTRENLSSFCGALFFYLGIRIVRHSFALSSEILAFKVSHDDINVRGYGVANEMVVVGNAFAGACSVGFGCICLLNHDLVLHVGSAAMSTIASMMSCFVFLGAFLAQMASFASMERLPALFSEAACNGDETECAAAFRARRLFVASNSTSVAWVCSIALFVYSFSHRRRTRSRRDHFYTQVDFYSHESIVLFVSTVVAFSIVSYFVDQTRDMDFADIELSLLLISVPLVLFGFPFVACCAHIAGQSLYVLTRINTYGGFDLTFFTHHSLLATLILTVVFTILSLFCYVLYAFSSRRLYCTPIEQVTAFVVTSLVSIQTFLTLATLGMSCGYTGILYDDHKGSWSITGYEFTTQHCVSFFFTAALFGSRYEHAIISASVRRAAWFIFPPVLGLLWIMCISIGETASGSPYSSYVDSTSFLIGVSSAIVSWVGIGIVLDV